MKPSLPLSLSGSLSLSYYSILFLFMLSAPVVKPYVGSSDARAIVIPLPIDFVHVSTIHESTVEHLLLYSPPYPPLQRLSKKIHGHPHRDASLSLSLSLLILFQAPMNTFFPQDTTAISAGNLR